MITTTMAFDTHLFVKKLTAAGMPEAQAEVLAEEQTRVIEDRLVTKQDIKVLRLDIEKMSLEIDLKLAKMKSELIHWILGAFTAQAAFVFSVIKFPH